MGIVTNLLVLTWLSFVIKNLKKFALCKSISQSDVIFIVYSEPIESRHAKKKFS